MRWGGRAARRLAAARRRSPHTPAMHTSSGPVQWLGPHLLRKHRPHRAILRRHDAIVSVRAGANAPQQPLHAWHGGRKLHADFGLFATAFH